MATANAETKATPPKEAKKPAPVSDDVQAPSGFSEGGNPDIDGWYKPEMGSTLYGKIVGSLRINGEKGKRDVVLVKLREPCKGFQKDDDTGAMFEKGSVLALGVSYDIREALLYVENQGELHITPKEKKKLGGKKTMWKFRQFYKGTKAHYVPPTDIAAPGTATSDDDDVPF